MTETQNGTPFVIARLFLNSYFCDSIDVTVFIIRFSFSSSAASYCVAVFIFESKPFTASSYTGSFLSSSTVSKFYLD